jgi:hypothetical protein
VPTIEYKLKGDSKDLVSATGAAESAMGKATLAAGALASGALALGTAYASLVEDTVAVVDEVNTLAQATGLSADAINGLRLAAKASGKELTDIVPQKLAKNMLAAADSGGAMADAFARVGVEFADSNGNLRDANAVFTELIQGLSEMDNRTEAAALAAQLLGKNGKELLTAFDDSAGFERFVELGKEFGTDVGPDAIAAASSWQAATASLSLAFEEAGASVLEVLGGTGAVAQGVQDFSTGLVFMVELAQVWAEKVIGNFGAVGDAISGLLAGNLDAAGDSLGRLELGFAPVNEAFETAAERAYSFWDINRAGAEESAEASESFLEKQEQIRAEHQRQEAAALAAQEAIKAQQEAAAEAAELEAQFLADMNELEAELAEESKERKREEEEYKQMVEASRLDYIDKQREAAHQAEMQREMARRELFDSGLEASVMGIDMLLERSLAASEAAIDGSKREQKEKQRAVKRAFFASQTAAVASIAIDAARSYLSLLPQLSYLTFGAPAAAAGIVAPVAALQTAQVLAQKPPSFHDGTDEVNATLRTGEAVLNQRAAEAMGRQQIEAANRGQGMGGAMVSQIVFQGRVLDEMVSSVIRSGGQTSALMTAGRPPAGTLDPFGGI